MYVGLSLSKNHAILVSIWHMIEILVMYRQGWREHGTSGGSCLIGILEFFLGRFD